MMLMIMGMGDDVRLVVDVDVGKCVSCLRRIESTTEGVVYCIRYTIRRLESGLQLSASRLFKV